ncbi:oxidoreductase [Psychromicrobium lacuslunae]|uniref:Probable oxidoreductase n=1 Tax=Psychromicrobium lacuslunae TaxID=1618207 RepID=A0A0D4BYB4_9MICC|nr:oxidoreductase [Psychromicrobium lacuslunae]AJT41309.1 oxidoreductase [Psychromicrobium lacuslunae]
MTTLEQRLDRQHPIPSGFTRENQAAEILAGMDLKGKQVLITGGYSGIGYEMSRAFSSAGANVIIPARRPSLAVQNTKDLPGIRIVPGDLADLRTVLTLVEKLSAERTVLDIVIGSAGIMAAPESRIGDGWESHFAINHLGHFALIGGLTSLLNESGSRVVMLSSAGHFASGIRWPDIHFTTEPYDPWLAYGQSKTANALFAAELAERGKDKGVLAYSVHPGNIMTPLQRHLSIEDQIALGWVNQDGAPNPALQLKTPAQGAATAVWAATSERLADFSGVYAQDNDVARLSTDDNMVIGGVKSWAIDPEDSARLWDYSVDITGVRPWSEIN